MPRHFNRHEPLALAALFIGARAVASSGIFVRFSQTGRTGFGEALWRCRCLPCGRGRRRVIVDRAGMAELEMPAFSGPACFFSGDLALWHWSRVLTSVTAATLEANLAPVFVALIAWIVRREGPQRRFAAALAIAFVGVLLIVSPKLGQARGALSGDLLGLGTAAFYGAYRIVVARLAITTAPVRLCYARR